MPENTNPLVDTPVVSAPVSVNDTSALFRKQIYFLLIVLSAGLMLGRIVAVDNLYDKSVAQLKNSQIPSRLAEKTAELEKRNAPPAAIEKVVADTERKLKVEAVRTMRPFLSANDRSRWCTIRAIVEPDMRVIETDEAGNEKIVWLAIDKVQDQYGWDTIDMVKHTLPPTASEDEAPAYLFSSKPPLLPILMAAPYYAIYHGSAAIFGESHRISFAKDTYLIVRLMLVIINLIPIVFCWFLMSRLIERFGTTDWGRIFTMGVVCFGTFVSTFAITINNHTPGICCMIISMYAVSRIVFDNKRNIIYFLVAGLFASLMLTCELPALSYIVFLMIPLFILAPWRTFCGYVPAMLLVFAAFFATNFFVHQTFSPAYANKEWYDYTYTRNGKERDAYWNNRVGIDKGEESKLTYLVNTTVGHHGIFSLTPVWILSFVGLAGMLFNRVDKRYMYASLFILSLSIICYVFYLYRPQVDRNYGGMTCGLRWMFWFIPLWTMTMIPVVDRMAKNRFCRGLCLILLLVSVMSVAYPVANPWDHPWAYFFMKFLGYTVIG
ncbi:MAG: hypothetical protein ACRC2T_18690 [Thermoguttaceae bacterium]